MLFLRLQTGQERWHPKWQTTLQMCVLSQAFQRREKLNSNTLWQCYSEGKQTAAQLAEQHGCSIKTIRRYLAKATTQANGVLPQAPVNLVMDTTYFGRKWGVMVLYDACSKRALMVVAVERETNALYTQAVAALREKGVVIQSIICDGKSGLLGSFLDIPVQLCQFHPIKIIVRQPDQKAKKPGSTGAAGPVTDPDGEHSSAGTSSMPPS